MTGFDFQGIGAAGESVKGRIEASNEAEALRAIANAGVTATLLQPTSKKSHMPPPKRRIGASEIGPLLMEWATLLGASLTIDQTLSVCLETPRSRSLIGRLEAIRREVRDGLPFHRALLNAGMVRRTITAMVEMGEVSGALPQVMRHLSEAETRRQAFRTNLMTALLYPAALLLTTLAALAVIVLIVAPNLGELFVEAGRKPPDHIALLLSFAHIVRTAAPLCGLAVLIALPLGLAVGRRESVRTWLDGWLLKIPLIGGLVRQLDSARFANAGALMIECGMVPSRALPLAASTIENRLMRQAISSALVRAGQGHSLTESLAQSRALSDDLLALIGVGLRTGKLADVLARGAEMQAMRAQRQVEAFAALVTPAVTIIAGVLVGSLAYLVMTAITSLNEVAFQ